MPARPDGYDQIGTTRYAQQTWCGRIEAIDQLQDFATFGNNPAEERLTLGRLNNPVRGLLHGLAALLSIAGLAFLVDTARQSHHVWSLAVYGMALVTLYTTSSLYHAVSWRPSWKVRLQRLDHASIYLFVAGTTTPIMVLLLDGSAKWLGLVLIWSLAAVGAIRELPRFRKRWSLVFQMMLGAAFVVPLMQTLTRMPPLAMMLVLGGGIVYLGGVTMFMNSWPRLLPRVFSYHEVFHVLVVLASAAHFIAVREIVLSA